VLVQILRESRFSPTEDLFACGACGQLYRRRQLRAGRGRHLGEHPDHEYAPCGHSQTWFGRRPVRACAHCGDPLPADTPPHVPECAPCFEWLSSTSGEDGAAFAA
jgi:hypothetical protein